MTENNIEQQDFIKNGILSHYIKWSYFADWLKKKAIIFGDYADWEDKSDVAILDAYVERNKNIPIRVLCLLNRAGDFRDSYYHWKVYTNKKDGIRIDFNKEKLLKALGDKVIAREVQYPDTKTLKKYVKSTDDLPFIKRASYDSDKEIRLIFSRDKNLIKKGKLFEFKVEKDFFIECIDGIRLSCSMSNKEIEDIKKILKKHGIEKNIYCSKIFRNELWEKMVLNVVDSKPSNKGDKNEKKFL